jgi:DNA-directed RNA polymerase subunit beta
VKIDRKRKAPVTQLLRIFGFGSNEEIAKAFEDVDTGEVKYIEATLKKDDAQTLEDSYLEIHKRLRPGDLVTVESARTIIDPMFFRFDRYDLSRVGRYKANQRLNIDSKKSKAEGLLVKDDLVRIVTEMIRMNNTPGSLPDDIDHLGNRRIRAVGELVQLKLRVGFARLRRGVQDRMSMFDRSSLQPVQLVNYKLLTSVVRDFFSSDTAPNPSSSARFTSSC